MQRSISSHVMICTLSPLLLLAGCQAQPPNANAATSNAPVRSLDYTTAPPIHAPCDPDALRVVRDLIDLRSHDQYRPSDMTYEYEKLYKQDSWYAYYGRTSFQMINAPITNYETGPDTGCYVDKGTAYVNIRFFNRSNSSISWTRQVKLVKTAEGHWKIDGIDNAP